jgi:diacylglycerol O-acyltransferase 1
MMFQIVLIAITDPFKGSNNYRMRVAGNTIFWITFCITGQPLAAIWYFYRWQEKYGAIANK